MEMKSRHTIKFLIAGLFILTAFVFVERASAQAAAAYSIKNGRMYIQMSKDIKEAALDSFITDNELEDLYLKQFIKTNHSDSLQKLGWKIEINNESYFIISKLFEPLGNVGD